MILVGALKVRPRMLGALAAGGAVAAALSFAPQVRLSTALVGGWDVFCAIFLGLTGGSMFGGDTAAIRSRAARDDEGRVTILALVLAACVAAFAGAGLQLHVARAAHGWEQAAHIALAFATVTLSWLTVHMIFAIHYAHGFYTDDGTGDARGLQFPGEEAPDYWDFLHFSLVIGVASQTADVAFTSRRMRRLGTVHGLAAFAFNTVIVALTINLLAGLF